jgi:hypothetical protein
MIFISAMEEDTKDWKLRLRYGKLTTTFKHFIVLADGVVGKLGDGFECRPGRALRALAGNGREKSKNGPLALASEWRRRVESAPSPMKKDPNQNSTDSAEIEALINRLERGQLRDEEGGHE